MDKLKELFSDAEFVKRLAVIVAGLATVFGAEWTPEQIGDGIQTIVQAAGVIVAFAGAFFAGKRVADKTTEKDADE